tara:strand:- start:1255 stop:2085 length:831 start_codon:yes stop_codon:yes gene_type:complete
MKKFYIFVITFLLSILSFGQDLTIVGVFDGSLFGGLPKGVEIYIINDVADLSIYGIGSANNGGGSDGEEFTFPSIGATAGDFIYIATEEIGFNSFFGFDPDFTTSAMSINGDDAIELFMNGNVFDLFGDINQDGTGEPWEYLDGWAYRKSLGPSETFDVNEWDFSGINALDGESINSGASIPVPITTYKSSTLSVIKNEIENFNMYPNPVTNGSLYLSSANRLSKRVQIYTLNGQQVYNKTLQFEENVNISNLNKGVYFVKIEESGRIATRKLIVN